MDKKAEFKEFAAKHPELVSFVKSGEMSWQKFYEIYDTYGEKEDAWRDYFKESSGSQGFTEKLKNIDMNSIFLSFSVNP